tara:strand:+ start:300 stop:788 length:489 start_codon:yes stop_codon:yes gene_type:complete
MATNDNFLSPLGFRLTLTRAPQIEFFCQAATLPSLALQEAVQTNPFVNIPHPGDNLIFDPISLRFRVDEDMVNYQEIFDWMVGLAHPEKFSQHSDLLAGDGRTSDASLIILNSSNNPKIRINFEDTFPLNLTPLSFDVTVPEIEYLEAEVSLRYRQYTIEIL